MALAHLWHSVDCRCTSADTQAAGIRAEAHGAAHVREMLLRFHERDDRVGAFRREFTRVTVVEADDVACELDYCGLHSEADPEKWKTGFSRVPDRLEHSLHSPHTKAARYENGVVIRQELTGSRAIGEHVAREPGNVDADIVRDAAVNQRFLDALVRVNQLSVFADHRNFYP